MLTVPAVTPVTIPVEPTVALPLLALHVPPEVASVNVIVEPTHTAEGPEIAAGNGFIVSVAEALQTPKGPVEQTTVNVPGDTGVTAPVEGLIVATDVGAHVHTAPIVAVQHTVGIDPMQTAPMLHVGDGV